MTHREDLFEELKSINKEIRGIGDEITNTELYRKLYAEERRLKELRKPIFQRYLWQYPLRNGNWIKSIKSSVKEGVKRGLGVKFLNQIHEDTIIKVVKELIKEDLGKTNEPEIILEISKINKEINNNHQIHEDKRKVLKERKEEINYELNKEEINKERAKEEKKKEVDKMVKEKLPELMGKIRDEVGKGLVFDALKK